MLTLISAGVSAEEANMLLRHAPAALGEVLRQEAPARVWLDEKELLFELGDANETMEATNGPLTAKITFAYDAAYSVLTWQIVLHNAGKTPLTDIKVQPLYAKFALDPAQLLPRVRHLSGSYHYDACYPPRGYRLQEEAFLTHDHAKPVRIEGTGGSSFDHVPLLEFAIAPRVETSTPALSGFYVGFEWSGAWSLEAGWERPLSSVGEPLCDFVVKGDMQLGELRLEAGETLALPRVHLGYFDGQDWSVADNALKRYVNEGIGGRLDGKIPVNPVTYDHWFGIHSDFDLEEMKRQATRAAELGCEYFCLDAGWYGSGMFGASGKGKWDEPDPVKFPEGVASVKELSDHVRALGMGFGLWHLIQQANGGTDAPKQFPDLFRGQLLRLELPEGRELALKTLRRWITDWNLTWMRWECAAGPHDLRYMQGFYKVVDTIRSEFPDLYIEGCAGGSTMFDLGMAVRTHGTWLNDHTANPDVCRFFQTGALRFWPSRYLNMAIRAHRNSGDAEANLHNALSRMPGTLSFNLKKAVASCAFRVK